ncbi:unnamed protein product [Anisakis simplex]|uniref:P-type domain-containing protein n=1 Tax=Anisakis simplex TaxID=6269 RepID=A0A0M3IYA7_ANISI|nr:unnamed protein product [Anisakis simplex]
MSNRYSLILLIASLVQFLHCANCEDQFTVDSRHRVDCYPQPNPSNASCLQRKCIWDPTPDLPSAPSCYYPRNTGFNVFNQSAEEIILIKSESGNVRNPYGLDISPLTFKKRFYGATLNIRIEPADALPKRFEPDIGLQHENSHSPDSLYVETDVNGTFAFYVRRKSTHTALWNTSLGGSLMFSDKYIQVATYFPSRHVYGFGENAHHTISHEFDNYTTWAMFARDEGPNSFDKDTKNLYGVYPFYICMEDDGKAHGVLIVNSNAQELTTGPGPHFVYRTIGGMLDIYFFPGPTPEEVVRQYEILVGKPMLPAYWALGFQLSRYAYKNLSDQEAAIKRTQQAGIPLDAANFDIDYMDRYMDFTIGAKWSKIGEFVDQMHKENLHAILIFDPAIDVTSEPFKRARQKNATFVEWPANDLVPMDIQNQYATTRGTKVMLGVVWPDHHAAFPDFSDLQQNTVDWWVDEFREYHKKISFDGIWIDMNEPASFGTNEDNPWYFGLADHPNITSLKCNIFNETIEQYDYPPFQTHNVYFYGPRATLASKTLCMLGTVQRGKQTLYNTKNLYGLYEAKATRKAIEDVLQKRGIVISRSTFPTAGRYAGHWLGDNQAAWPTLITTIIGVQDFNMFGIPYVGSDICGFNGDTTEELCLRWQQLGAFHSFSRNHNNNVAKPQDPAQWPSVAKAARMANLFRYRYLPYLYSLHFYASKEGGTVIRPMFFNFPKDPATYDKGLQFMWGDGLMVIPAVQEGVETVSVYLPNGTTWYSPRDEDYGNVIQSKELSAKKTELTPVLIKGGVIIPRQVPSVTTAKSRQNPFQLLVAVDPVSRTAEGFMYWDDGESVVHNFTTYPHYEFRLRFACTTQKSELNITRISKGSVNMSYLNTIDVFGAPYEPDFETVKLNGKTIQVPESTYNASNKFIRLTKAQLVALHQGPDIIEISWTNKG